MEVNFEIWKFIVASANAEVPENKKIDEMIAKGRKRGPEGLPGGPDPWHKKRDMIDDWDFVKTSRLLYTFLLSSLYTELHGKTIGIEGRNGFELYRQVVKVADEILEHAKF